MTATLTRDRDRLAEVRRRLADLRRERTRARHVHDMARESFGNSDFGGDPTDSPEFRRAEAASREVRRVEAELELTEAEERSLLQGIDPGRGVTPHADSIFTDPETIERLQRMGSGSFPIGAVDLGPLSTRDQLVRTINTGEWGQPKLAMAVTDVDVPDSARTSFSHVQRQPRRRLSLLDLIPVSPMDGRSFSYLQEAGDYDVGAAETAEGAVKPQADFALTEAEAVAATIATWQKMKRQQMADLPELQTILTDRLTYAVLRRLENQVLSGDGVGENLAGLLGMTGLGDIVFSSSVPLTDLALDGIVATLVAEAEPDAVAVNPIDWGLMLRARTSGSGERLDSGGAFQSTPLTLWGLPAVPSTALAQGEALVGAFGTQARIYIREPITVRVSDATDDDFVRNVVRALAEMRAGLAVWQPSAFSLIHLK